MHTEAAEARHRTGATVNAECRVDPAIVVEGDHLRCSKQQPPVGTDRNVIDREPEIGYSAVTKAGVDRSVCFEAQSEPGRRIPEPTGVSDNDPSDVVDGDRVDTVVQRAKVQAYDPGVAEGGVAFTVGCELGDEARRLIAGHE